MNAQDIQSRIATLFEADPAQAASDLPKVVVWYDPAGEFAEDVAGLDLPEVEVLQEEENHLFALKRRLNELAPGSKVLLYRQRSEGDLRDNWLADVEMYATPFKADFVSMLMADIAAQDSPRMRAAVTACKGWLSKKTHAKRVRELSPQGFAAPRDLYLAVMASALGKDVALDTSQVAAAFMAQQYAAELEAEAEDTDVSELATGPAKTLAQAGVWEQMSGLFSLCGCAQGEFEKGADLRRDVLVRALAAGLPAHDQDRLSGAVTIPADPRMLDQCREVARIWKERDPRGMFDAARQVEAQCKVTNLLKEMPPASIAGCEVLPCVDEVLIQGLFASLTQPACDVEAAISLISARRPLAWGPEVIPYYDVAAAIAQMRRFEAENASGFFRQTAGEVWQAYTEQWWRMDACYRQLHRAAAQAMKNPVAALDDELKSAVNAAEGLYKNWYLTGLERAWEQAAGSDLAAQGYVNGIDRQELFYMNEVGPLSKTGRVFVVVSDALRYEVARELADALEGQTQGKTELASMQAVFPSITKCGMAALLPHGNLGMQEGAAGTGLCVTADGLPTASTENRQDVLRAKSEGAVAVRYDAFMAMRKEERKQLVAPAKVVYVYHDLVDAVGDSAKTERDVFDACSEAVRELVGLVRVITGELRCSNVVITADHGFLYTYKPLGQEEKVAAGTIEGEVVEAGRRYVLGQPGSTSELLTPVSMRPFGSDLAGFAPRDCLRIAKPGAGQNYVHGGISLQELCVPVLRFKNLRANARDFEDKRPSAIELLTSSRIITSNRFSREFYQVEPVGGKVLAATYEVTLVDTADTPVSDAATLQVDRTSEVREDRRLRVTLNMRPGVQTSSSQTYLLQVKNAATGEVVLSSEQRVEIAFASEFDW